MMLGVIIVAVLKDGTKRPSEVLPPDEAAALAHKCQKRPDIYQEIIEATVYRRTRTT